MASPEEVFRRLVPVRMSLASRSVASQKEDKTSTITPHQGGLWCASVYVYEQTDEVHLVQNTLDVYSATRGSEPKRASTLSAVRDWLLPRAS